jgi:hypothetical protein
MKSLTERLAGYLLYGEGYKYCAVMRQGDRGQCVHLAPHGKGKREPTLCGIDRTDNGPYAREYRRGGFIPRGMWKRIKAVHFAGRDFLLQGGLLGWEPSDRHLCRKCLHALPKKPSTGGEE